MEQIEQPPHTAVRNMKQAARRVQAAEQDEEQEQEQGEEEAMYHR
jgi:hypothetical protein